MKHVVMFSGGLGSFGAALRLQHQIDRPRRDLILYFSDTQVEDEDLYRFLYESALYLRGRLIHDADGRNIWEVFKDVKYVGNTRVDPCSRILKRERESKEVHNF